MSDLPLRWQDRVEELERRVEDHWRVIKDDQRRQDELERLILMWGDRVIALEAKAALAVAPRRGGDSDESQRGEAIMLGQSRSDDYWEQCFEKPSARCIHHSDHKLAHFDAPETRTEEKMDPALDPDTRLCHPWTCPIHRVKFWVPDGNEGFACPICDTPSPPASAEPGRCDRECCPHWYEDHNEKPPHWCSHAGCPCYAFVPPQPSAEERPAPECVNPNHNTDRHDWMPSCSAPVNIIPQPKPASEADARTANAQGRSEPTELRRWWQGGYYTVEVYADVWDELKQQADADRAALERVEKLMATRGKNYWAWVHGEKHPVVPVSDLEIALRSPAPQEP